MKLFDNPRFQAEYKEWSGKLKLIENEKTRALLDDLLTQLVRQVKDIDSRHDDLVQAGKIREDMSERRDNLTETRRKISRIIRDWEETQKLN